MPLSSPYSMSLRHALYFFFLMLLFHAIAARAAHQRYDAAALCFSAVILSARPRSHFAALRPSSIGTSPVVSCSPAIARYALIDTAA